MILHQLKSCPSSNISDGSYLWMWNFIDSTICLAMLAVKIESWMEFRIDKLKATVLIGEHGVVCLDDKLTALA